MRFPDHIKIGTLIEVDDYYIDDDRVLFIVIERIKDPKSDYYDLMLYDASDKQSCRIIRESAVIYWLDEHSARIWC